MIKYAREDTHYLLYIYDELRKELINKALERQIEPREYIKSVLNKSRELCLRTYQKPKLKDGSYYDLLTRNKPIMSTKKYELLKALLRWRDKIARLEDESVRFILPNNVLFQLIDSMPKTTNELYAMVASDMTKKYAVLKKYAQEVVEIIKVIKEKIEDQIINEAEIKHNTNHQIREEINQEYETAIGSIMQTNDQDKTNLFTFTNFHIGMKTYESKQQQENQNDKENIFDVGSLLQVKLVVMYEFILKISVGIRQG